MQHLQVCRSRRRAPPSPPRRFVALPRPITPRERARRAANGALRLELRAVQHLQVCSSSRHAPPFPPRRAAALPWSMKPRERARRAAKSALRLDLSAVQHLQVCSSSRCGTRRRTVPRSWRERRHERASRRLCSAPRCVGARGVLQSRLYTATTTTRHQPPRRGAPAVPSGLYVCLRCGATRHGTMPCRGDLVCCQRCNQKVAQALQTRRTRSARRI
jgi:hypothetical protein